MPVRIVASHNKYEACYLADTGNAGEFRNFLL